MKELDYLQPDIQILNELNVTPTSLPRTIPNSTVVRFAPGIYTLPGWMIPETSAWIGSDAGPVKLRIIPNPAGPTDRHTPQAFARSLHCMLFYAHNIEFDMDWAAWMSIRNTSNGNFKLGCVALAAWQFKMNKCTIRRFGSDGEAYGNAGNEVFPILAKSWAGPGPNEQLRPPCIEVSNCLIEDPYFFDGGYGTAIHPQTNQDRGDRFIMGTRTTQAAHIHDNTINIPGGIGLGAGGDSGGTEQAIYENNIITGKCMFNCDTGRAHKLIVRDNTFVGPQGPNLEAPSSYCEFRNNHITITEPFFNKVLDKVEDRWAFRLKNNQTTIVDGNLIVSDIAATDLIVGVFSGINQFKLSMETVTLTTPTLTTPTLPAAELVSLRVELAALRMELTKAKADIVNGLDARLALNEALDKSELRNTRLNADLKKSQEETEKANAANVRHKDALHRLAGAWTTINRIASPYAVTATIEGQEVAR